MASVTHQDAARLRAEMQHEVRNLAETAARIAALAPNRDDTTTYALALLLMNYYTGAEHLFRRVAALFGGLPPAGERWHVELLEDMKLEIEGIRPAVLAADTAEHLLRLLRFRHVVRSLYAWSLRRADIDDLLARLADTHDKFAADLSAFGEFLGAMAAP